MLKPLSFGDSLRYEALQRNAVLLVSAVMWASAWWTALAQQGQEPLHALICWAVGPAMLLVCALGYWRSWHQASMLLSLTVTVVLLLLGWWGFVSPVALVGHVLVLLAFTGLALGFEAALLCAAVFAGLIAVMCLKGFLSLYQALVVVHSLALVLWVMWQIHKQTLEHLEVLQGHLGRLREQDSQLKLLSHAIEQSADSVAIVDYEGRMVYANQAFERQSGRSLHEAMGRYSVDVSVTGLAPEERAQMRQVVERGEVWRAVLHNRRKDDALVIESVSIAPVMDDSGQVTHFIESRHDLSEQLANERRIEQLQHTDELTQLPNRTALLRGLDRVLLGRHLQRSTDASLQFHWHGLLLVDLDRFSLFNDARGNVWGDMLVAAFAQRIQEHLPDNGWMARTMVDRFAVVFEQAGRSSVSARREVYNLAMQLQAHLRDLVCEGEVIKVSCGIGFTMFSSLQLDVQVDSSSHILRRATMALHQAKRQGAGQTYAYNEALTQSAERKLQIESDLYHALQEGQLQLYVQPQVNSQGQVQAAEALLRWQHPKEGWISPAEFIPVAEEAGLIVPLGDWVLQQVCELLTAPAIVAGGYSISANISALQLVQADFVPKVQALLARTGANPSKLTLEVTEGTLLDDVNTTVQRMQALQAQGVQFALDDFGTGYSSLSYLMKLPIQEIKLDQSFIRELDSEGVSGALVQGVLMVARRKGMRVVAEGVERLEQASLLRGWDDSLLCQGYYFSRPIPIAQWLANPQLAQQAGEGA